VGRCAWKWLKNLDLEILMFLSGAESDALPEERRLRAEKMQLAAQQHGGWCILNGAWEPKMEVPVFDIASDGPALLLSGIQNAIDDPSW
jgi:hypothetical protein